MRDEMAARRRSPLAACRSALIGTLAASAGKITLDDKGYVGDIADNLIEGVTLEDFEADLRQGDGNELGVKFRAAHSSSALAVNVFAPFKSRLDDLRLAGRSAFTELCFERKCDHGLVGRRPPNLDLVARGTKGIVAIESKCLEPLSPHVAKFADAYANEIVDGRRESSWFQHMLELGNRPQTYRWLDAAQLIKHAFGLANTFANTPSTLLYLYWEPSNPEAHPIFAQHRAEIRQFAASVATPGASLEFAAMSYPELWSTWRDNSQPDWLRLHAERVTARYAVRI